MDSKPSLIADVIDWIDVSLNDTAHSLTAITSIAETYDTESQFHAGWYTGRQAALREVRDDLDESEGVLNDIERLRQARELTALTVALMNDARPDAAAVRSEPETFGAWTGRLQTMKTVLVCLEAHLFM